jgi:hypothetical protein
MISRAGKLAGSKRVLAIAGLAAVLGVGAFGAADGAFGGGAARGLYATSGGACASTVMGTLGEIADRIYGQGIKSERTEIAQREIAGSRPLRTALEHGQPSAVAAAARAIVGEGHMTNLTVFQGSHTLANVGSPAALTPLRGSLTGAHGRPLAGFIASVWSDGGFVAEAHGLLESVTVVRSGARTVIGALALPHRALPAEGSLESGGVRYRYASFPALAYPTGAVRIYLFRRFSSFRALCGRDREETLVNTLRDIAGLIYAGETGPRAEREIRRVQRDRELLAAVAARNPRAAERAIDKVLNQHIVRLRVLAGGHLLSDVGGPHVLGPRTAPLTLHGRRIGTLVLSIQDDRGYEKLTDRLAGLRVLMFMGRRLVINSLGPPPATLPAEGLINIGQATYRVFTLHFTSFPSGPLRVVVFAPIPYA